MKSDRYDEILRSYEKRGSVPEENDSRYCREDPEDLNRNTFPDIKALAEAIAPAYAPLIDFTCEIAKDCASEELKGEAIELIRTLYDDIVLLEEGIDKYKYEKLYFGEYTPVIEFIQKLAEWADVEKSIEIKAQTLLSSFYLEVCLEKKSMFYTRLAAENGDIESMWDMASSLEEWSPESELWYEKIILAITKEKPNTTDREERQHMHLIFLDSLFHVALNLLEGKGVSEKPDEAVSFLSRAAKTLKKEYEHGLYI